MSAFRRPLLTAFIAALGALGVLSATANAATQDAAITLASPGVTPGQGSGFGVYNFNVAHDGPAVFPFATGDKRGHCVEATILASSGTATLESDADANLAPTPVDNNRVAWLMLSTLYNQDNAAASPLTLDQRASAHQSATWQITDPGLPQTISGDPAVVAEADRLLAASSANQAAAQQVPSLIAQPTPTPCGPGSRGVEVKGAPFTSAELTITSANGRFTGGGTTTTVDLGPTGTASTGVTGALGTVTISGTVQQAKLVYVDFAESQDFAYAETTPVPVELAVDFPPCATPVAPTTPTTPAGGSGSPTPTPTTTATPRATLTLTKRGAKRVRAGRKTTVIFTITNTSRTTARNVVLTDRLPKGVVIARRTSGMTVRGRQIAIRVGSLGPGRKVSRRIVVSVLRSTSGRRCSLVTVRSSNANTRRASCCMQVLASRRPVVPAVTG